MSTGSQEQDDMVDIPVLLGAEQLRIPSALARDPRLSAALTVLDNYSQGGNTETMVARVEEWATKEADSMAIRAVDAVISESLKEAADPIIKTYAKDGGSALKKDCKDLFKLHVTSVVSQAKEEMQHGTKLAKVGKALSFTGELWDGLSDFWHSLVAKHPVLKPLDMLVVRPTAISLYLAALPELAVVKACEFIGRSISGYAKTGKVFSSIAAAAKKTGASIIKRGLRLCSGAAANPAITAFYNAIGLKEGQQKDLLDMLAKPEHMKMLKKLTPDIAAVAAEKLGDILKATGLSISDLAAPVLDALSRDKPMKLDMDGFMTYLDQKNPALKKQLDPIKGQLATLFDSSKEQDPATLSVLLCAMKKLPDLKQDVKKELLQFVKDYAVGLAVDSVVRKVTGAAKSSSAADVATTQTPVASKHTASKVATEGRKGSFVEKHPPKKRLSSNAATLEVERKESSLPTGRTRHSTI